MMKKDNLLRVFIVLIGCALSFIKYNVIEFVSMEFEYFLLLMSILIVAFFALIIILNRKVYKLAFTNPQLTTFLRKSTNTSVASTIKPNSLKTSISIDNNSQVKAFLSNHKASLALWILVAVSCSYVSGYYFKKPGAKMLQTAIETQAEWRKDLFLESMRTQADFFDLKVDYITGWLFFKFNWLACIVTFLFIMSSYFIFTQTTIPNLIKSKLKPYLK